VWPTSIGTAPDPHTLRERIRAVAKSAGFEGSAMSLRHLFASIASESVELTVVSKLMWHRRASTTSETYAHLRRGTPSPTRSSAPSRSRRTAPINADEDTNVDTNVPVHAWAPRDTQTAPRRLGLQVPPGAHFLRRHVTQGRRFDPAPSRPEFPTNQPIRDHVMGLVNDVAARSPDTRQCLRLKLAGL
jgi:hypothetical protein